jgi:hypothetical protein
LDILTPYSFSTYDISPVEAEKFRKKVADNKDSLVLAPRGNNEFDSLLAKGPSVQTGYKGGAPRTPTDIIKDMGLSVVSGQNRQLFIEYGGMAEEPR